MTLSLAESQAVTEIAQLLSSFLPGTPHPYADPSISLPGVAQSLGLSAWWVGGSKVPALTTLLGKTLESRRTSFCKLILEIVCKGLTYRRNTPITRDEIDKLNGLVARVHFKIPELWDSAFLDSLSRTQPEPKQCENPVNQTALAALQGKLIGLGNLTPQQRGFAFETFLQELFTLYGLSPRRPFRLVGEQIDGSFQLDTDTYLVEAKWHEQQIGEADLLVFRGKVEGKAIWSRGLFIAYNGFSGEGLQAFSKGRSTNIIGMTGQDIHFILEGEMSLIEAIHRKARRAAETGDFYVSVYELARGD